MNVKRLRLGIKRIERENTVVGVERKHQKERERAVVCGAGGSLARPSLIQAHLST